MSYVIVIALVSKQLQGARMMFSVLAMALLAPAAPAPQANEAAVQTPTDTQAAAPEKIVCKVDDEDTFSRIRQRVCKPQSQWQRPKERHPTK